MSNTELIISDHRHNPFLSDKIREKIEALKSKDLDLWKVYARGITGRIEGLIFKKWYVLNESFEDKKLIGYGIDFGFSNDPTSLIEVRMQDGELYVKELIYETGLTNQDISNIRANHQGESIQVMDLLLAALSRKKGKKYGEDNLTLTERAKYCRDIKVADVWNVFVIDSFAF